MKSVKPYLKAKEQLLAIEWAKTNKWDIRLLDKDAPEPFKKFFPAQSVTEPVFSMSEHTFNIGMAGLNVIDGYAAPSLSITFYDTDKCVLEKYFENWCNSKILGNYTYVLPIESSLKTIEVYRYDNRGKKVWSTLYNICPKGSVTRESNSSGEFILFTVEFIIASMTRK